jgi:hypothetical protein
MFLRESAAIGIKECPESTRDSSLADSPSSLFSGHLGMLAIVFIGILNWGHAVDSGRALELDALVCDTWSHRRVLLEDALRGA